MKSCHLPCVARRPRRAPPDLGGARAAAGGACAAPHGAPLRWPPTPLPRPSADLTGIIPYLYLPPGVRFATISDQGHCSSGPDKVYASTPLPGLVPSSQPHAASARALLLQWIPFSPSPCDGDILTAAALPPICALTNRHSAPAAAAAALIGAAHSFTAAPAFHGAPSPPLPASDPPLKCSALTVTLYIPYGRRPQQTTHPRGGPWGSMT